MRCVIPKQSHLVYPAGKPIIPHLRRYRGFAVVYYSVTLDALYLGHPRLSLNRGSSMGIVVPLRDLAYLGDFRHSLHPVGILCGQKI